MYKIFICRWLSFAVGYPSPWVILRRWLSFAVGYPLPWAYCGHIQSRISERAFSAAGSLRRRTGLQNTLLSLIINKLHIFLSSYFSVYARGSKIIEHQNTFISKQLEILER